MALDSSQGIAPNLASMAAFTSPANVPGLPLYPIPGIFVACSWILVVELG
jgi:hypothetical protein